MSNKWTNEQVEYALGIVVRCLHKSTLHQQSIQYYEKRKVTLSKALTAIEFFFLVALLLAPRIAPLIFAAKLVALACMEFHDTPKGHKWSDEKFFHLAVQMMSELSSGDSNYRVFIGTMTNHYDRYSEDAPEIPNPVIKEFINKKNEF